MDSYLQNYGQSKTIVDGNIIDDVKWNAIYDGDVLDLEAKRNDESIYIQMDTDEIMKLLEVPANNKTIDQRLKDDLLHPIRVEPIIIEEMRVPLIKERKHTSHSKKHKKRKSKRKSRSKSNSKSNSKSKSKSKSKSRKITPDYLKTIY
jgi:hypothetical protein